jgi:hypothetical protein
MFGSLLLLVNASGMKSFKEIEELIKRVGLSAGTARALTLDQVESFDAIVSDDNKRIELLEVFRNGRMHDSWLALDWPNGFDEMVICAPLCKLVNWECALCHVGRRQNDFSCADDNSIFGYIAVLLALENRDLLKAHLDKIKKLLVNDNVYWDMARHDIFIK